MARQGMWGRHRVVGVATALMVSLGIGVTPAWTGPAQGSVMSATVPGCASTAPGGEWRSYGHDDAQTRTQPAEDTVGLAEAAILAPAWSVAVLPSPPPNLDTGSLPGVSALNGTPVVADGCVYAGGSDGVVVAVNADTGQTVWRSAPLNGAAKTGQGGAIVSSVAVADGKVLVMVDRLDAPFAVALDQRSGKVVWQSAPVSTYPGSYTNANPGIYQNTLIFGFSVPEGDPKGVGGFALIDVRTGQIQKVTPTIPPADQASGYAGGGIWTAPAVDAVGGAAYMGAGNPASKQLAHQNTDAILKIDLKHDGHFGEIVDAYKGNPDQYQLSQLTSTPVCAASEGTPLDTFPLDDPACGQLDLDFGATPNLFDDGMGHLLVGELQKSGYYHAAYAGTMTGAWTSPIGAPCALCNAASTATAGTSIFGVGTPGGVVTSLTQRAGTLQWSTPLLDGVHYGSVSTADGVVYTLASDGSLVAFDAATGAPLLHRPIAADVGAPVAGVTSAGVAIARHTVYVEAGNFLVAYRPTAI